MDNLLIESPTNLIVNNVSTVENSLTWNEVNWANGYKIYRSIEPNGPYTNIGTTNNLIYNDTSVIPNTKYYYYVTAFDENNNETDPFNIASATTQELPSPRNLNATYENNQVNLSWSEVENATSYQVKRAISNSGPFEVIASTNGLTYVDNNVNPNTTYYYTVNALNGANSNVVSVTTEGINGPSNLTIRLEKCNQVILNFDNLNDATLYNVYQATNQNGPFTFVNTTTSNEFIVNNLNNNTTYYYRVTALINNIETNPSNVVSATTLACQENCYTRVCQINCVNGMMYRCCYPRQNRCICCE